jgi:hypothetical protein
MGVRQVYEINPDRVIHETDVYVVDVGPYPEEQLDCYRVWNKYHNVLEHAHSMFFFAVQWANEATRTYKAMDNNGAPPQTDENDLPEVN